MIRTLASILMIIILSGCAYNVSGTQTERVGMLVETSVEDQAWGQKGYKGLKSIEENYDVDIYHKEGIDTYQKTSLAVQELVENGTKVIFGHSNSYGEYFQELHGDYPDVQFIYFNGDYVADNVTSINFDSTAMGFFGGMVAAEMSETNKIGMIASFSWQPEVEGFYEGVKHVSPDASVHVNFTNSWDNTKRAYEIYREMEALDVDVFYPAGDQFSAQIIQQAERDGHYSIGYVMDQSDLGARSVLTSTVQHVDQLYVSTMELVMDGDLEGKKYTYDFGNDAISLGEFSPEVPPSVQSDIEKDINEYKDSGELPNRP
ncbi:BMP family ABC transporter substrate-binding protein [Salimicrobium halophilum]|uniref:Nucleoside-binding protein n=1 Tax=Salimicrobium halophilum TaxID=86666 RepID=A0A1G8TSG8_9BACI|nr:BMP family ABC transporter substrate-binding protein [Salimicrobium halophilum]SDJ44491.1 nucleoside-binding protein [Salimicrobium halophilum]